MGQCVSKPAPYRRNENSQPSPPPRFPGSPGGWTRGAEGRAWGEGYSVKFPMSRDLEPIAQ
jgi:hypothetical protein